MSSLFGPSDVGVGPAGMGVIVVGMATLPV